VGNKGKKLMDINKIIKQLVAERNKKIQAIEQQYDAYIEQFKKPKALKDKYKGKKEFTEKEIKDMQSILCYKNIAYCCSAVGKIRKPCLNRDTFLSIIGWTKRDFEDYKKECGKAFLNKLRRQSTVSS